MKEVSDIFGKSSIYESNEERLFFYENTVGIIIQEKEYNAHIYVFTDLVIIG